MTYYCIILFYFAYKSRMKNGTVLTCKLDFSIPADNSPKCVGGDALIHSPVVYDMRIIDQQVPLYKAVVWIWPRVYFFPIHFPPGDKLKKKINQNLYYQHHHLLLFVRGHFMSTPGFQYCRGNFIFIFPLNIWKQSRTHPTRTHIVKTAITLLLLMSACTEMQMYPVHLHSPASFTAQQSTLYHTFTDAAQCSLTL